MKKFVVERILPGAGNLSPQELQTISEAACLVAGQLEQPYHWIQSFITDDKIYCLHIAESEEMVREHSRQSKLAVNMISEVRAVIDPLTSNPLQ
ncbi:MAG TPA: DUF4242 domain-containing protein [Puia sp.]|nr:DUF4242 domain-containing protein [Puia sp.]